MTAPSPLSALIERLEKASGPDRVLDEAIVCAFFPQATFDQPREREVTEEEAKTKWCPFARVPVDAAGYAAGNRFDTKSSTATEYNDLSRCIGSACMAWQWTEFNLSDFNEPALPVGGKCGLSRP